MKTLFVLPLLLALFAPFQQPTTSPDASGMNVLAFKCSRSRQSGKAAATSTSATVPPAPAMIDQNKNFQRNARVNDPAGVRDPNQDTIDGRSAALEKAVGESRAPKSESIETYAYQVKVHNGSSKTVEIVFWEYQFIDPANSTNLTRRQFLCGVNIKGEKDKVLEASSLLGPADVVNAQTLASAAAVSPEKVVINRVEFADGSIWQRKDWNAAEIKLTFQHAMATPWNVGEMCRGL